MRKRPGLVAIAGLALLTVGCGSEQADPTPVTSETSSPVAAAESAGPALAPPPVLEPEDVRLSCGSPLPFGAEALRGPGGAEQADHPAAAALRDLLEESSLPARGGWQVVVLTGRSALFLLPEPRDSEFPYWSAEFETQGEAWTYVRSGQCQLRPIFEGMEAASWVLAPGQQITRDSKIFDVLVTEASCSSGQSPEGRIVPAAAIYQETSITVIFAVRPLPGAQTCQGAPPATVTLQLDEQVGDRRLLDGSVFPAEVRAEAP